MIGRWSQYISTGSGTVTSQVVQDVHPCPQELPPWFLERQNISRRHPGQPFFGRDWERLYDFCYMALEFRCLNPTMISQNQISSLTLAFHAWIPGVVLDARKPGRCWHAELGWPPGSSLQQHHLALPRSETLHSRGTVDLQGHPFKWHCNSLVTSGPCRVNSPTMFTVLTVLHVEAVCSPKSYYRC